MPTRGRSFKKSQKDRQAQQKQLTSSFLTFSFVVRLLGPYWLYYVKWGLPRQLSKL